MKIIIDTDKKTIEVPNDFKEAYESEVKINKMLNKEPKTIIDTIDITDYKVTSKIVRKTVDKTTYKKIVDYMENIKTSQKEIYEEYQALLQDAAKKMTKDNKPKKVNFLKLRKWFYEKFPEENPFFKKENEEKEN